MIENVLKEKSKRYTYSLLSDCHDTDADGYVRPSGCLRYMQTGANLQLYEYGPTGDELRVRGQAFVITRIALEFYQPIKAYQNLVVQTWGVESRGFSFGRCYEITDGQTSLVRAQSVWALLDIENKKPLPVSAFEGGFGTDEPFEDQLPLRLYLPNNELFQEVGCHRVTYAETDANQHMNNTFYPDMLLDFLPLAGKRVRSLTLNFCREAPRGQNLTVFLAKKEGQYFFRTYREDGSVNVEAAMTLVPFS